MKSRIFLTIVLLLVVSLSMSIAQTKADCPTTAANKSCCVTGSKASMTKAGTDKSTVMFASDKKADTKTTKAAKGSAAECTDAEKAQCDMKKGTATKTSNKMDCCKDKAKSTKAEKKSTPEKSEAKGTN